MINIRSHFYLRYCQRIVGMPDDKEILRYIAVNRDQLTEHITRMWEHAHFLWKGQLGDNVTRDFHINGDVIMVADTDAQNLFTLYRIDFGFPEETNKLVIADLIRTIEELRSKSTGFNEQATELLESTRSQREVIERELKAIAAEMEALEARKRHCAAQLTALEEEVKSFYEQAKPIRSQIDHFATMLCSSLQYRRDLGVKEKTAP